MIVTGTCFHCKERPATEEWILESEALALTHGFVEPWCMHCVLIEQIAYAERLSAAIPEMRKRLAALERLEVGK